MYEFALMICVLVVSQSSWPWVHERKHILYNSSV